MIRFAKPWEMNKLRDMWRDCFDDSPEYAEFIFKRLQRPDNILVLTEKDKPVAMLSFRGMEMVALRARCGAAYIYGVATLPKYRGKGYSTRLLENAGELFKIRRYSCSVLVPADENLAEFYSKRGYEPMFRINKATVAVDEIPSGATLELTPLTAGRFAQVRGMHFADTGFFARWDRDFLGYIIDEASFYGGGVFEFTADDQAGVAVCYPHGDTLYVKELSMKNYGSLNTVLRSLAAIFPQKEFLLYLREDVQTSYTNNLLPFGMTTWYDNIAKSALADTGAPPYLAHALD